MSGDGRRRCRASAHSEAAAEVVFLEGWTGKAAPRVPVQTAGTDRDFRHRRSAKVRLHQQCTSRSARQPGLHDFHAAAKRVGRAALRADLRHEFDAAHHRGDLARLGDAVRQRLLAEHMLAGLQRGLADRHVPTLTGTHDHGVEVFLAIEQSAEIVVDLRAAEAGADPAAVWRFSSAPFCPAAASAGELRRAHSQGDDVTPSSIPPGSRCGCVAAPISAMLSGDCRGRAPRPEGDLRVAMTPARPPPALRNERRDSEVGFHVTSESEGGGCPGRLARGGSGTRQRLNARRARRERTTASNPAHIWQARRVSTARTSPTVRWRRILAAARRILLAGGATRRGFAFERETRGLARAV